MDAGGNLGSAAKRSAIGSGDCWLGSGLYSQLLFFHCLLLFAMCSSLQVKDITYSAGDKKV